MESFESLFKKQHKGELILGIILVIYLVMGLKTPETIANLLDNIIGKVVVFIVVIYLFVNCNPILGILALFAAFKLIHSSAITTGSDALQKYVPTEEKKASQFSAYNQFPYTLEQEVVAKMAPILQSGSSVTQATYKPILDNLHYASSLKQ